MPSRILVVDDDPSIRRILATAFQRDSTVLQAENGADALEKLHTEQPDFMITDLHMPKVDGFELLRRARASFVGAGIPIMMLTSDGDSETLFESFEYGVDDFLKKPFSVNELKARVSSIYLRQKRARDVNPLTRLPGNLMLKSEITKRIHDHDPVAIAYVDLDHFKAFNDYQGFDRGDHVIELLADILRAYACRFEPGQVFLGHVGGDDFVVILPIDAVEGLAEYLDQRFTEATELLYSPDEWQRGYYEAHNRSGQLEKFELLSVSIGVLTTLRQGMDDLRKVAQVAAEVKKQAKAIPGNSLFVDRRTS
ncbi:MAG: response regulator [Planctomycetes bacterium]|nr:response regulator [Planctomycetota bacterium]